MRVNKAFSLIELSIVILVISVLVIGVYKSFDLVAKVRIKATGAMTISSNVSSIKDLYIWLETTREDSFITTEVEDGSIIKSWRSINPQISQINYAMSLTSSVSYKKSSPINSLPSLYFNKSNTSHLVLSTKENSFSSANVSSPNQAFTYFIVAKANSGIGTGGYFIGSSWGYSIRSNARTLILNAISGIPRYTVASGYSTKPEIITITSAGGICGKMGFYVNSSNIPLTLSSTGCSPGTFSVLNGGTSLSIGRAPDQNGTLYYFDGYISEFIMYRRGLKQDELRSVEKYLSEKYKIKLSA